MKKGLLILGIAAASLTGCKQFEKGPGDMLYKIHEDKDGELIKDGDFVSFKAIEKTEEDSILYSSYDYDRPTPLIKEKAMFKGDLYTAIGMLSEGDSATFKISLDSLEKKMNRPKIPNTKGKYLVYNIKVDKVISKGKLKEEAFRAEVEKFFKGEREKAKNLEAGKISGYISSKDLKPTATASGLNYVITQQGKGTKPAVGDTVEFNYTGMFLTGKIFDTSVQERAKESGTFNAMRPYQPIKVPAGVQSTIPGFDEALMLFPKGTKATIILPSKLAYGEQGTPAIPSYMPLVFDIEVVNVIPKKAGSTAPTAATPPVTNPAPQGQKK
jgi:FKBP-type peptidyl-prolyl cis-trans isomerase FkpA